MPSSEMYMAVSTTISDQLMPLRNCQVSLSPLSVSRPLADSVQAKILVNLTMPRTPSLDYQRAIRDSLRGFYLSSSVTIALAVKTC